MIHTQEDALNQCSHETSYHVPKAFLNRYEMLAGCWVNPRGVFYTHGWHMHPMTGLELVCEELWYTLVRLEYLYRVWNMLGICLNSNRLTIINIIWCFIHTNHSIFEIKCSLHHIWGLLTLSEWNNHDQNMKLIPFIVTINATLSLKFFLFTYNESAGKMQNFTLSPEPGVLHAYSHYFGSCWVIKRQHSIE